MAADGECGAADLTDDVVEIAGGFLGALPAGADGAPARPSVRNVTKASKTDQDPAPDLAERAGYLIDMAARAPSGETCRGHKSPDAKRCRVAPE
jgi:hypothetical protein